MIREHRFPLLMDEEERQLLAGLAWRFRLSPGTTLRWLVRLAVYDPDFPRMELNDYLMASMERAGEKEAPY